jgi:hypothetical protein
VAPKLGHINRKRLKQIQIASKNIEPFDVHETTSCQSCIEGKPHKRIFPNQDIVM